MPRIIPSGLATWLNNYPLLETHSTLQVALPFSENADTFYYATLPVTIGGQDYRGALKTVGELKLSMGKAADRVEAVLSNEDGLQGPIFFQAPDVLRGNVVKIGRLYFNPQDASTQHHVILFVGVISSFSVDDTDIRLSIVSDLYGGGMTGARRLVSPTCQFKFKDEITCGYVGAATTCDKLFATCEGYNNKHRFGGALFKDSKTGLQTVVGGPPPVNQLIGTRLTSSSTTLTNFKQRTKIVFEGPAGTVVDDEENDRTIVKAGAASIEGAPIQVVYIRPDNTPGTDAGFDYTIDQHVTRASGGFFNTVEAINVQTYGMASDFYASGSAATATASINSGTDQLTFVTSVGDFKPGHGIAIPGARTGGLILYTTILSISGLVVTLADNAGATVSNVTVQHDDTAAIQAAYADAVVQEKALFFPAGTYVADTLTVAAPYTRIYGEGSGKTLLKARSNGIPVIEVTGGPAHSMLLENFGIEGFGKTSSATGHGIYVHDTGGLAFQIAIRNVEVRECGGRGIFLLENFSTLIDNVSVSHCGDNAIEGEFDNSCTFINCYVHDVADGKAAYRIYSGGTNFIGCNGIDSGANTWWAILGKSLAGGDDTDAYCRAQFIGCNVEDSRYGIWCKAGSYITSIEGTSFFAPVSTSGCIATKIDFTEETTVGVLGSGCRFALKSGAAWLNGQPIHANTVPFIMHGNRVSGGQYWDTSLNGGLGLAVDLPYLSVTRNSTTNEGGVYASNLAVGSIDSDFIPTIANFRDLGSSSFTLKAGYFGTKVEISSGAFVGGSYAKLTNGANPNLLLTGSSGASTIGRVQVLDASYMQIGTDTNHGVVIRTNNIDRWMVDANGTLRPAINENRDIGFNGGIVKDIYARRMILQEAAANGVNGTTIKVPDSASNTFVLILPDDIPSVGQVLKVTAFGSGIITTAWEDDVTGSSTGANTSLSNLTSVAFNQHLLFGSDNVLNIGAVGGNRPANLYVANSIVMGNGAATVGGQSWTITGGANSELKLHDATTGSIEARFKVFTNDRAIVGTITNHDLSLFANNADRWRVKGSTGHFLPELSNVYDIGGPSNKVRDGYFAGDLYVDRDLTVTRHVVTGGGTPSVTPGIGAGSGASAFVTGNDICGLIQLTCGPSPAINSTLLTVTFAVPYSSTPKCVTVTAANANAGNHAGRWFTNAGNTTTTQFALRSGTTALASAGIYQFYYEVKG